MSRVEHSQFAGLAAVLLLSAAGPASASPASGAAEGGGSNEAEMAKCAWSEAPATAAVLVARAKFDKRYVYDADGSPTVGPLMRVRAACWERSKAFAEASGTAMAFFDNRKFLEILAKSKPGEVGSDRFAGVVRRCEFRFLDEPKSEPASIVWSFDTGGGFKEFDRREKMLGLTFTDAEFAALMSPKKGKKGTESFLRRAEAAKPVRVSTVAAGKASGQPYAVDYESAAQRCKVAKADGSYEDA
jgi:hypothetical protein